MNRCPKCGFIFARRATLGMRIVHRAKCDPDFARNQLPKLEAMRRNMRMRSLPSRRK